MFGEVSITQFLTFKNFLHSNTGTGAIHISIFFKNVILQICNTLIPYLLKCFTFSLPEHVNYARLWQLLHLGHQPVKKIKNFNKYSFNISN